jgi:hypothetical protein
MRPLRFGAGRRFVRGLSRPLASPETGLKPLIGIAAGDVSTVGWLCLQSHLAGLSPPVLDLDRTTDD